MRRSLEDKRLERKKKRKSDYMNSNTKKQSETLEKIFQTEFKLNEYLKLSSTTQNLKTQNLPSINNIDIASDMLKAISHVLNDNYAHLNQLNSEHLQNIDPSLDFRFIYRDRKHHINLPPIKTRLQWQIGEYPFFKINTHYANQETESFTEKRLIPRYIRCYTMQDYSTGEYVEFGFPTHEWPIRGMLYITNQRLLFRKNKQITINIPFGTILAYYFYADCLIVEYTQTHKKLFDAFFVDFDKAQLLEAMIRVTI